MRRSVTHGGGKGPMVFVGHYFDGLYYYYACVLNSRIMNDFGFGYDMVGLRTCAIIILSL